MLRIARLEHEGERRSEFLRLQLLLRGFIVSLFVRAMRQHAIVERYAARQETLLLGIILAEDQPHELAHDIDVKPGWTERMLRDEPPLRENHEIDIRPPGLVRWRCEHGEDRRVRMIEQNCSH